MKKKLLSLLIIGGLFAGMGLSAECFAAPEHHREIKKTEHNELRHTHSLKKPAKQSSKKSIKKESQKKHQAIKKHQQAKFKAQKQHQKNVKKHQKNSRKTVRNFKKNQNKTQHKKHKK